MVQIFGEMPVGELHIDAVDLFSFQKAGVMGSHNGFAGHREHEAHAVTSHVAIHVTANLNAASDFSLVEFLGGDRGLMLLNFHFATSRFSVVVSSVSTKKDSSWTTLRPTLGRTSLSVGSLRCAMMDSLSISGTR